MLSEYCGLWRSKQYSKREGLLKTALCGGQPKTICHFQSSRVQVKNELTNLKLFCKNHWERIWQQGQPGEYPNCKVFKITLGFRTQL